MKEQSEAPRAPTLEDRVKAVHEARAATQAALARATASAERAGKARDEANADGEAYRAAKDALDARVTELSNAAASMAT